MTYLNSILSSLPMQKQQEIMYIYNQAKQSPNPEQFLTQKFGNNPNFQKAFDVFKYQGADKFNSYLSNIFGSMSR